MEKLCFVKRSTNIFKIKRFICCFFLFETDALSWWSRLWSHPKQKTSSDWLQFIWAARCRKRIPKITKRTHWMILNNLRRNVSNYYATITTPKSTRYGGQHQVIFAFEDILHNKSEVNLNLFSLSFFCRRIKLENVPDRKSTVLMRIQTHLLVFKWLVTFSVKLFTLIKR